MNEGWQEIFVNHLTSFLSEEEQKLEKIMNFTKRIYRHNGSASLTDCISVGYTESG